MRDFTRRTGVRMRYKLVMGVGIVVLLTVLSSGTWATSYTFTQIIVPFPGTTRTEALGINNAGQQVVGRFVFFIAGQGEPITHGFLLDTSGAFTQIDVPVS